MSEEINVEKYATRARSFGLNVFYGQARSTLFPVVFWDNDQGDYVKFLKLAKDIGATIIVVDKFVLEDSEIDRKKLDEKFYAGQDVYERVKDFNARLEGFRQYAGKVGTITLSWFRDGIEYSFMESLSWSDSYFDLLDEIEDELGSRYNLMNK